MSDNPLGLGPDKAKVDAYNTFLAASELNNGCATIVVALLFNTETGEVETFSNTTPEGMRDIARSVIEEDPIAVVLTEQKGN